MNGRHRRAGIVVVLDPRPAVCAVRQVVGVKSSTGSAVK